ncbi:hypothetical protein M9H77_36358 [Catharanthus roseus]|uniref:Uncharacterized protein n=1 Tax=Catharanthus roseus TaxID=4058 RepID=A0ACB9ZSE4_CATRO|nr:hypothetical protein M9H77_36358 [Catharanthus roseus]
MMPEPKGVAPADTGDMGIFIAGSSPIAASPIPIPPVESVSSFPALPSLLRGKKHVRFMIFQSCDEAMSESSQSKQSEPIREATPRLKQVTHKVMENFMIKMTKLLEASMATRRNERFYKEVEQEIKYELFLEQLNDIYNTLKYEDAMRVTLAAFRLHGMAKNWRLRTFKARALKDQPWTWNDFFKKNSKRSTYLVGYVRNEKTSFSN